MCPLEMEADTGSGSSGGEEEQVEGEDLEEGTPVTVKNEIEQPTPQEIREHMASHIPFRAWCPHCVTGKAKGNPHFKRHYAAIGTPTIAMDYMYMREERKIGGSRETEAEDGEEGEQEGSKGMPILVCRDNKTGWYQASVVPKKGRCPHAVQQVENMLNQLGYKKYILKTDQEPSIMELKEVISRSRGDQVIMEESPVMDSRSNGFIERAIQSVQGQIRTLKSALESNLGGGQSRRTTRH